MKTLIEKLNIKIINADIDHIEISETRKAKGAFRWNYTDNQAEIVLSKSANQRTLYHELGHAINFILGNGKKYSDSVFMESEQFANVVADILELCYSKNAKEEPKN